MDEHEVLQHLLDMEAQAANLVDEAQAESERRIFDGGHQNSARYEEVYARELQAQEESYIKNLAMVKEDYRKQLEAYRESLKDMPLKTEGFFALAEKFLLAAAPPCKES